MAWSLAAIAWGIAFVGTSELTRGWEAGARPAIPRAFAAVKPDAGDEAGVKAGREATSGTPRWVYPVALIAIGLVAAFVIVLHVMGGGVRGHAP